MALHGVLPLRKAIFVGIILSTVSSLHVNAAISLFTQ